MLRTYPYLIDTVRDNENVSAQKRAFLAKLDDYVNKKQYVRITLLTWHELALKEIQGELTGGTINKDGSSAIRRTCSLTAVVNKGQYDIEKSSMDFSINKKVFIEIGIKNESDLYPEYPILWFPQGVFYISSFSITSSATSSINISLSLKDKMASLNGDIGGTFPTTTELDVVDDVGKNGLDITKKVKICDLIQELVHHWGGEELENIVIEDIPDKINRIMKWNGDEPLYISQTSTNENDEHTYDVLLQSEWIAQGCPSGYESYAAGEDVGYVLDDFVYTDELTVNGGESVVSALDKIKSYLGNYEYFYDEYGFFHFREIKNYLNTKRGSVLLEDMSENDYLVDANNNKSVYSFANNTNITNLSVNPQYSNIKNDFVVNGLRKATKDSVGSIVKYHLVIDDKPQTGNTYMNFVIYYDEPTGEKKAGFPVWVNELPEVGNPSLLYGLLEMDYVYMFKEDFGESDLQRLYNNLITIYEDSEMSLDTKPSKIANCIQAIYNYLYTKISKKLFAGPDSSNKIYFDEKWNNAAECFDNAPMKTKIYMKESNTEYVELYGDSKRENPLYAESSTQEIVDNIFAATSQPQYHIYRWGQTTDGGYTSVEIIKDYFVGREYVTKDSRTDIYLQELMSRNTGLDVTKWFPTGVVDNYGVLHDSRGNKFTAVDTTLYGEELVSFWTSMYDIEHQKFLSEAECNGNYFLDFIDPSTSGLGEFSIGNIGRRTIVKTDENINCLFVRTPKDIYFLCLDDEDIEEKRTEYKTKGYSFSQVRSYIYTNLSTGGSKVDAYSQIQYMLAMNTNYQKAISISALPIFYLEPNVCIDVNDRFTNTKGIYTTKTINLPLAVNGIMSVTANESFSKI